MYAAHKKKKKKKKREFNVLMIKQELFFFKKIKATELCEGQREWYRNTVCVEYAAFQCELEP